jgi:cell division protein ZapA (FtsZ GTPase activity inhibitor)
LFGRDYSIKGHGETKYVEMLVDFINERAENIRKKATVLSTLDLAILTLLNITDEMFQERRLQERNKRDTKKRKGGLS